MSPHAQSAPRTKKSATHENSVSNGFGNDVSLIQLAHADTVLLQGNNPASSKIDAAVDQHRQQQADEDASSAGEERDFALPPIEVPEDVFSLSCVCDFRQGYNSSTFLFCMLAIAIKWSMLILILFDLLNLDDPYNPLGAPPCVALEVTLGQGVSMCLAATQETNVLTAWSQLAMWPVCWKCDAIVREVTDEQQGQHKKVANAVANFSKFLVTTSRQLMAGLAFLLNAFVLNMQSSTALSLMLNFAALAFLADIPRGAFWVAKNGYISSKIQQDCPLAPHLSGHLQAAAATVMAAPRVAVTEQQQPTSMSNTSPTSVAVKRVLFVLVALLLLACCGVAVHQQRSGKFLCDQLPVQFGDAFRPDLPLRSGVCVQRHLSGVDARHNLIAGHVVHEDVKRTGAFFPCCQTEQAWTFSGPFGFDQLQQFATANNDAAGNSSSKNKNANPCNCWTKSPPTTTCDKLESFVASSSWLVQDFLTNQAPPIDVMKLVCDDCNQAHNANACNGHGACVKNACVCHPGRIGVNCEHQLPCPGGLVLDERSPNFPCVQGGKHLPSTDFSLLVGGKGRRSPATVCHNPVHISSQFPQDQEEPETSGNHSALSTKSCDKFGTQFSKIM